MRTPSVDVSPWWPTSKSVQRGSMGILLPACDILRHVETLNGEFYKGVQFGSTGVQLRFKKKLMILELHVWSVLEKKYQDTREKYEVPPCYNCYPHQECTLISKCLNPNHPQIPPKSSKGHFFFEKISTVGNWYFHLFKWGKITTWQEVQAISAGIWKIILEDSGRFLARIPRGLGLKRGT